MLTKLRPGVRAFLKGLSSMYELHVYTMGAKRYAAEMVKLLDPDGRLGLRGTDRVIGKEDSTAKHLKSLDVVIGKETVRPRGGGDGEGGHWNQAGVMCKRFGRAIWERSLGERVLKGSEVWERGL
eukprot:3127440-Pleurochrysis_carterae.AAC.1